MDTGSVHSMSDSYAAVLDDSGHAERLSTFLTHLLKGSETALQRRPLDRVGLLLHDLDAILGTAADKSNLCGRLADTESTAIDAECRGLLDAARRLNEVNRQLRNLIAANVGQRLEALTGVPQLYRAQPGPAYAYAQTGRG